jgi:hypothetical protein
MNRFDYDRFNGFARKSLDDFLFSDLWNHDIFNESDMHSAAYYYIREYFSKQDRDKIYVRCEPPLDGMKPDIVVYERGKPIYVLEFKCFTKPEYINETAVYYDLDKLAMVVDKFSSVRWGFFHMIYDADEPFTFSDSRLRRAGYSKISFTSINARRQEENNRRRVRYDEWRSEFDGLHKMHLEHS